jgi:SAM-dependent methyltransferase
LNLKAFNAYSDYYDLLYLDKDYVGESIYVQELLRKYGLNSGRLLEFGSGTGRHGCLLANAGYDVHGIELSPEMVALVKPVLGFSCQVGDVANTITGKKYDAVLSLFHVLSYQISNQKLNAVCKNASIHLELGGLFIFDFWYSPAVYSQYPEVRVKRISNEKVEITRIAEPKVYANENRVDVNYTIFVRDLIAGEVKVIKETHPMRHFSLPEMEMLAKMNGFEILKSEEFLTGKLPGEDTWGICVVLKKVQM